MATFTERAIPDRADSPASDSAHAHSAIQTQDGSGDEDGVILVSIDDNEVQHVRMLMDEVFGAENFIAQIVWEKGRKNDAKLFSTSASCSEAPSQFDGIE